MAVIFEELEGSPTFAIDRRSEKATRMTRVAWEDIDAAAAELMPLIGFPFAPFPGRPLLMVSSFRIEPFIPVPLGLGEVPPYYPGGAKFTIEYETFPFDLTTPDKDSGPSGGEDDAVIEYTVNFAGEFLTLGENQLVWFLPDTWPAAGGSDEVKAGQTAGKVVPNLEHALQIHYVVFPPWQAIRDCLGCVNLQRVAGAQPQTLLFLGAEIKRSLNTSSLKLWQLAYKFAEKNMGPDGIDYGLIVQKRWIGWNHFWRDATSRYEPLMQRNGQQVYMSTDQFPKLFQNAS